MTQRKKKDVVSRTTVMFGFLICNILQAQLSVCWKSSDPFVCLGADCIKSSTAVFKTGQTFYFVAAWTYIQEQICLHVVYCFTPGTECKFQLLSSINIQLLLYRLLSFKISLEVIIFIFLPIKEQGRLLFDGFSANLDRLGLQLPVYFWCQEWH